MSQFSTDLFNDNGDLAVEIGSESDDTMYEAPTPSAGGGTAGDPGPAGDGPPQRRGRRGLVPGTKRGPYKRVPRDAQDRVVAVSKEGGD